MAGRVRVLGGFAAFGAFWGAWGATLPAIQAHAGVDDGADRPAAHRRGAPASCARDVRRPLGRPGAARDTGRLRGGGAAPGAGDVDGDTVRRPARPGRGLGRGRRGHQRRGRETEAVAGRPILSLADGTFSARAVAGSLAAGALRAAGAGGQLVLSSSASWGR